MDDIPKRAIEDVKKDPSDININVLIELTRQDERSKTAGLLEKVHKKALREQELRLAGQYKKLIADKDKELELKSCWCMTCKHIINLPCKRECDGIAKGDNSPQGYEDNEFVKHLKDIIFRRNIKIKELEKELNFCIASHSIKKRDDGLREADVHLSNRWRKKIEQVKKETEIQLKHHKEAENKYAVRSLEYLLWLIKELIDVSSEASIRPSNNKLLDGSKDDDRRVGVEKSMADGPVADKPGKDSDGSEKDDIKAKRLKPSPLSGRRIHGDEASGDVGKTQRPSEKPSGKPLLRKAAPKQSRKHEDIIPIMNDLYATDDEVWLEIRKDLAKVIRGLFQKKSTKNGDE